MDPRIPALASSLLMSTHVSAAFSQNTPIKGERCKYQNNSKIKYGETRKTEINWSLYLCAAHDTILL